MPTDELGHLLETLGLLRHAAVFAANDVDLATLRLLTDADLEALGLSLGHRRRLMAGAASFVSQRSDGSAAENPALDAPGPEQAERRQITVMFCDLVDSTALTAALDPEAMEPFLQAYQDLCAAEITRLGGFVERFIGDGVLAYFGYPRADEDAAERAVQAGLGVVRAVRSLVTPLGGRPSVRVGIATGLVVARGRALRGSVNEHPIVGETVNLAARLQSCAGPDGVVIADATRRLVANLFDCESLGPHPLKGLPAPVPLWRVLAQRHAATRFEAAHATGPGHLVGRDHEMALLRERWALACAGEGQAVLLSGDAGIGKSRLGQALCEHAAARPGLIVRCQCSPSYANSTLQPLIGYVEHAGGIAPSDPPGLKLDKLERWAATLPPAARPGLALLATLLSIPASARVPDHSPSPAPEPEQQKRRLLAQLAAFLGGGELPVLLLIEDAHWIDPTTRDLLDLVIDRAARSRCLVMLTFRPEFQHRWHGRDHVTALALSRIGRRHVAELVGQIASGLLLPPEVLEQILSKTDGVPLFVEELTKAVIESGLLRRHWAPSPPLAIPATLNDSLLARLDRLGPAKRAAQVGSVIGRAFSHGALSALADLPGAALDHMLRQLVAAELVHQAGQPPQATYTFKHALVQDAAYGTLLLRDRERLHARCADALRTAQPGLLEEQPEVLAGHYAKAGLAAPAVELWLAAGQRAISRSAHAEAVEHFTQGLDALRTLPPDEGRDRTELLLQTALGMPLIACRGYAAPEAGEAFRRARALAERLADDARRAQALYGLWAHHSALGQNRVAEELAGLLLALATGARDTAVALVAHRVLGVSRYLLGDHAGGRAEIEASLLAYDPALHQPLTHRFGQDQRVAGLSALSAIQWTEGSPDQALRTSLDAVATALDVGHANSLGYALAYGACPVRILRGDWADAARLAAMLLDHARDHRLHVWHAHAVAYRAEVLAARGSPAPEELAEAIAQFRAALVQFDAAGARFRVAAHRGAFALALSRAGQLDEALVVAADAIEQARRYEEVWCLAELLRVRGEVLAAQGDAGGAEAAFLDALATSRRQRMRGWELRAALSLAALWRTTERAAEARALVAASLAPFAEGVATADVAAARALMARHPAARGPLVGPGSSLSRTGRPLPWTEQGPGSAEDAGAGSVAADGRAGVIVADGPHHVAAGLVEAGVQAGDVELGPGDEPGLNRRWIEADLTEQQDQP